MFKITTISVLLLGVKANLFWIDWAYRTKNTHDMFVFRPHFIVAVSDYF